MARNPREILNELSRLDLAGRGEAFVEARFITPLLEALGYEGHRDYEVLRHGDDGSSFKLRYPSVESGAKPTRRYNPDFIPTVRKKMFWIIKAKTAVDEGYPFSGLHIVQGLQYCIHPEVQAKYLLLTNGRHSAVYDAQASILLERDIYDPILEFHNQSIDSTWDQIYELLSVERLRGRIETDLKSMYDRLCLSSLDKTYPDRLLHQIGGSRGDNVQTIEGNVGRLQSEQSENDRSDRQALLNGMTSSQLNDHMDLPLTPPPNVGELYVRASLLEGLSHKLIADALLLDFERRTIFRKEQVVLGLCHLYRRPDIDSYTKRQVYEFFENLIDRDLPVLSQVECGLLRFNRKSLIARVYSGIRERIATSLTTAPEIIRFITPPTSLMATVEGELFAHQKSFARLRHLSDEELGKMLPVLLKIEADIEPEFQKALATLRDDERQIGGFETYGFRGRHWAFVNILKNCGIIPEN